MLKSGELQAIAKEYSFATTEDLFAGVGYGLYTPLQVLGKVIPEPEKVSKIRKIIRTIKKGRDDAVKIKGIDGLAVKFARCCNPIPGDAILGFITRGRGLTVHLADCPNVHSYDDQRKVDVQWQDTKEYAYPVKLRVQGTDKKGLLSEVTNIISAGKANILNAQVMTYPDGTATSIFEIEINHASQLQKIIKSIQKIKEVRKVERMRSSV
jgi:guanosine-3',5'-bis(diphosphate) 3'-pyrophosphohydrolase